MFRALKSKLTGLFDSLLERIVVIVCALAVSQFPQYMNQYLDALKGALFESEKSYSSLKESASETNKSVREFIDKHLKSNDLDFMNSGKRWDELLKRYEGYKFSIKSITEAGVFMRPIVFLKNVNWDLASKIKLKPAVPLTWESFLYAIVGILIGMGLYRLITWLPRKILRRPSPA